MFNAFKGLAEGVAWSIVGMINFRVGITALVAEVFELLNTITFGKNNDINKAAGETGGEAQRARDERDAAIANAHVIMGMTEAGASALATAEAMDKLTRSTTNMPTGYRVDVAAARAQDANPSRGEGPAARERSEMQRTIWAKAVEDLGVAASNLAKKSMQVGEYVATGQRPRRPAFASRT